MTVQDYVDYVINYIGLKESHYDQYGDRAKKIFGKATPDKTKKK
jgi:hypothetical protein